MVSRPHGSNFIQIRGGLRKTRYCEVAWVHFDGKLLPAITGGPEKEERDAIFVTGSHFWKTSGYTKGIQAVQGQ